MSKALHRHRKKENTIQILQFDTYFLNVDFPSIHLFHHTIEGKATVDIVSIVIEKVREHSIPIIVKRGIKMERTRRNLVKGQVCLTL